MIVVIFAGNLLLGRITGHFGTRFPLLVGLGSGALFAALLTGLTPQTPIASLRS